MEDCRWEQRHSHCREAALRGLPNGSRSAWPQDGRRDHATSLRISTAGHPSSFGRLSTLRHGVVRDTAFSSLLPRNPCHIDRSSRRCNLSRRVASTIPQPKYEILLARSVIRGFLSMRHSGEGRFDKLCVCPTAQPSAAQSQTRLPGGSAPVDPQRLPTRYTV